MVVREESLSQLAPGAERPGVSVRSVFLVNAALTLALYLLPYGRAFAAGVLVVGLRICWGAPQRT